MTNISAKRWANGLAVATLLLLPISFMAQTPAPPETTLQHVRMGLIVTDGANRSVQNVRKENIQLTEEGQQLNLSSFAVDKRPVRGVLALDTSGSLRSLLELSVNIAKSIIANKKPDDEMMIVTFVSTDKIQTLADFSTDSAKLIDSLKLLRSEGGQSAIIDAAYLAVQTAAKRQADNPGLRAVVVMVTDGEDRQSYYKQEQLVRLLRENDVQMLIIGLTRDLDNQERLVHRLTPRAAAEKLLRNLAEETGGRAFFAEKDKELIEATEQVILDLNSQYLMGFDRQPVAGEKGIRKVKISIINDPQAKDLRAITRPGYWVGPKEPIGDPKSKKKG